MTKYTLLKNKETGARSIRIAGAIVVRESEDPERYAELRTLAVQRIANCHVHDNGPSGVFPCHNCGVTAIVWP